MMGERIFGQLTTAMTQEPTVSIRLNPLKCYYMPKHFESRVPWCNTGYYLTERPNFTFDPIFHTGLYYVQEASSMFIHQVLRQFVTVPSLVLDLCAAPGGKSTAARTILPHGSVLVSNEPVRQRAQILSENIQKFGHRDCLVTNNYPRDFRQSGLLFDVVIADVPCSGEGMFRKDEGAVSEWSPQNIERCATLQREIVADIWDNLKPGGLLVYSTCTFNTKENEENVQWIQQHYRAEILAVDTDEEWHIKGSLLPGFDEPVYRFLPGFTRGEGLFMAVLRKNWDNTVAPSKAVAPKPQRTPFDGQCRDWLPEGFTFVQEGDRLLAIPDNIATVWATARKSLKVLHAGITIGTIKGRNLIPDQSLALSAPLHRDAFPQADLDYETAIMYLRRESITLPSNTPLGFVLITYRHIPLGFVKNIGNRANNLYPAEWKIKSTHMPLTIPAVLDINS